MWFRRWFLFIFQLIVLLSLLMWFLFSSPPKIDADILSALPQSQQNKLLSNAEQQLFSDVSNYVVFSLSGNDAIKAYDELNNELNMLGLTALEQSFLNIESLSKFYRQYGKNILSGRLNGLIESGDSTKYANFFLEQLGKITDPFVSSTFNFDPSLNTAELIAENIASLSNMELYQGRSRVMGGTDFHYMLILALPEKITSIDETIFFANSIVAKVNSVNSHYPESQIKYSGVLFHTAENASRAKQEIGIFGLLSMIGIAILIIYAFRSAVPLVLALLTIVHAFLYGSVALFLFFDTIHMLTLVFAVTVVGVAIDYCFHGISELIHRQNGSYSKTFKFALTLGFVTTSLGYLTLLFSPLELLSQVATFFIFGLLGALVLVRSLVPNVLNNTSMKLPGTTQKTSLKLRVFFRLACEKSTVLLSVITVSMVVFYLINPVVFNDDVRLLNASSKTLLENEAINNRLLGNVDSTRVFITANSFQELLEREELLKEKLHGDNKKYKVNSISNWIPSIKQQKLNNQKLNNASMDGLFEVMTQYLSAKPDFGIGDWVDKTSLDTGVLAETSKKFIYNESQNYVSWMQIGGLEKNEINKIITSYKSNAFLYDKAASISAMLSDYRDSMLLLLLGVLIISLVVLITRYGGVASIRALSVLSVSLGIALLVSFYMEGSLNIFNILASLLIIALAIDYLVFYFEQGIVEHTVFAISLSATSSILAFGMLAMSDTPAVSSFGMTVMVGIVSAYFLSPLAVKNSWGSDED